MLTQGQLSGWEPVPPFDMASGVAPIGSAVDDSAARARARVGSVLSEKWKLERLLGIGGMGAVYAGLHRNGARAAVKVLHPYLAREVEVRNRFLREGYAANRVEHPGVVKVLDDDVVTGGPDEGTAYLVMELLVGESLEGMTRRGLPLTERDFLVVADVVLEVLEVAHARGVVHRDIKPDNIFITRSGVGRDRIKVLDFGLARLLEGRSSTVHGIALGTPPFMSPEQAAGQNEDIDGRTDLFSLAASGFRLITGRRIHEGVSSVDVLQKMGKLRAPRVHDVAPEVSEALARVLDRALEFRREDRYESASLMRADVQRALAVVELRLPLAAPVGATGHPSIELSATDLSAIASMELSAIEDLTSRLSDVAGAPLSESDFETVGLGRRAPAQLPATPPATPPIAVTQPMLATDPILAAPRPEPAAVAIPLTPWVRQPVAPVPPAPAPRPARSLRARIIVGVAVVGAGLIFALGWLSDSPDRSPSETSPAKGTSIGGPTQNTHLAPPPARPARPGNRTR